MAEVSPVYRKGDVMDKENYRSITVLPNLSNIFQKVMVHQLTIFNDRFSPHLSGYRKIYNYQDVLLTFVNTYKSGFR